ncbi:hypothetical protein DFS33DRAFT_1270073 [Desarmillaria ectypa]|nr:hypothetical protein DFS33DRAFT_1270073 [Desarmillaria ectypa]
MARTKVYPGLNRPLPSHISEIIRNDHSCDPEYPTLEELSGNDLLMLDGLRRHCEERETLDKEEDNKRRWLFAGMLRKEEKFSHRELVDFARGLGIEVDADADAGDSGTARTKKMREKEREREQREAVEREYSNKEPKMLSRKVNGQARSSGPRWLTSREEFTCEEEEHKPWEQEENIEIRKPLQKQARKSKVLPPTKMIAENSVTETFLTRSSTKEKEKKDVVIVNKSGSSRKIMPLPKRPRLVPIDNNSKTEAGRVRSIDLTPQRKQFLDSLAKKPISYHPDGKERNLKSYERMKFLQEDEWAASVAAFSVECKACGCFTSLDPRSPKGYDPSLWMRHRTRCQEIFAVQQDQISGLFRKESGIAISNLTEFGVVSFRGPESNSRYLSEAHYLRHQASPFHCVAVQ